MKWVWTPHLTMKFSDVVFRTRWFIWNMWWNNWFLHETVTYMYMDILMHDYALTCLVVPQMPWCWGQWGCLSLGTVAPSLHCSACGWEDDYTIQEKPLWVAKYVCSLQSDNLRNLRILRLSRQSEDCNLKIVQMYRTISRLCNYSAQSRDCAEHIYIIKDMLNSERTQ